MISLLGKAVSPGLAKGTAFVYIDVLQRDAESYHIDPADLAVVFSTAMSDMRTNDYMCRVLVDTPGAVSPTKFHNSVNNAATGYWSIATGSSKRTRTSAWS